MKKGGFHVLLVGFIFVSILLVLFIDFYNIEAFNAFNQKFLFDLTWKGRMFYLFFVWLLLIELVLNWRTIAQRDSVRSRLRVGLALGLTLVPIIYIVSVNFLGADQLVLNIGQGLQIRSDFLMDHWPLSVEYLIFLLFFSASILVADGIAGIKSFSISIILLAGIALMYLIDTIWPYGTFAPLQLLTLPTAACATALLHLLGYHVDLSYPISIPEQGTVPSMIVGKGGAFANAYIAWPCAGGHSLLLFTLITLVFFKKANMVRDRKVVFFLLGAMGTYLVNILRVASFFVISIHYGRDTGRMFHDSYGELYFMAWMFSFIIIVLAVQSDRISRIVQSFRERVKPKQLYSRILKRFDR